MNPLHGIALSCRRSRAALVLSVALFAPGCSWLAPPPADPRLVALPRMPDAFERHQAVFEAAVGEPMAGRNQAQLLVDGPETHGAMFDAIRQARRQVLVQTYILEDEGPGERLAELLVRKRAQGLDVRVLYDSVGSLTTPKEYFDRLRAGGITVCEFNPVNPAKAPRGWQVNNRNHRKILVVDGEVAFTGGINISSVYSSGSSSGFRSGSGVGSASRAGSRASADEATGRRDEGWRDTHVMARGPVAQQFHRVFAADWEAQKCPDGPPRELAVPAAARDGWPMRVVVGDPSRDDNQTYAALLNAIAYAERRVWLTYGYFVPDPITLRTLTAAATRGVDVRLMLPGFSDSWLPLHAGRSHYETLLAAGVRIYERQGALLHAKTATIDGVWSSVGSTNLDWRSHVHNYEADVVVLGAAFAAGMEQLFEADVAASREITATRWRERGLKERFLEAVARQWEYLL
jgi:cardiolipin synthase